MPVLGSKCSSRSLLDYGVGCINSSKVCVDSVSHKDVGSGSVAVVHGSESGIVNGVSCNYAGSRFINHLDKSFHGFGVGEVENIYAGMKLVGDGLPGKGCGDVVPTYCCSNPECSKLYYGYHSCRKKSCPDCWEKWKAEEVDKITARLLCSESKNKHRGCRLVHVILSPKNPEKFVSREELSDLIRDGYLYLKKKGVVGGVMVIHPYRAKAEAKEFADAEKMKHWEWIRAQKPTWNWYKIGLHFHIIGFMRWMKPPEEGEEWVYKVITDKKNNPRNLLGKGLNPVKQIRGLSNYELGHTVSYEGDGNFQVVRWFGDCGNNKMRLTEEEKEALASYDKKEHVCKLCGAPLSAFWTWVYTYFYDVQIGGIPPPDSFDEICDIVYKSWQLPKDYKDFLVC